MNILLLTQVVPFPPDSGPKVKTHHVLRYLAQRHAVHLVSFVRSAEEEAHAQALKAFCAGVTTVHLQRSTPRDLLYLARSFKSRRPFLIERDDTPQMRGSVASVLERNSFDAIHADQLSMAQFAIEAPVPLRVLDEHNAVWTIVKRAAQRERGIRRALAELEWRKLRSYEGAVCKRFDRLTVVSTEDRAALETAAGRQLSNSAVIPIAIDVEALPFVSRTVEARDVLSVATMFYPPNAEGVLWFAERVFPLVRSRLPQSQFYIVGSRPPSSISRLARADNGIVVTGYVADLEPILRHSSVLVVPVSSGSGMRVKILEAFARGIAVVSTTVGIEGIPARHDEHLLVADEPETFARAVSRLIADPTEANRLARAARALVEQCYDWRIALRGLDDVYQRPSA